jgi:hypothetical protein
VRIDYGNGPTHYGPGVDIQLTGDEVATAVDAYLVAHGVYVSGPRTIRVNGQLCEIGSVYVDPSGFVITPEGGKFDGRGIRPAPSAEADSFDPSDRAGAFRND